MVQPNYHNHPTLNPQTTPTILHNFIPSMQWVTHKPWTTRPQLTNHPWPPQLSQIKPLWTDHITHQNTQFKTLLSNNYQQTHLSVSKTAHTQTLKNYWKLYCVHWNCQFTHHYADSDPQTYFTTSRLHLNTTLVSVPETFDGSKYSNPKSLLTNWDFKCTSPFQWLEQTIIFTFSLDMLNKKLGLAKDTSTIL